MKINMIVVAGGTGFIGRHLTRSLVAKGHTVTLLTRHPTLDKEQKIRQVEWDGHHEGRWCEELKSAEAVINLSGASISKRWTTRDKGEIIQSRLQPTRTLIQAMKRLESRPKVLINASAIGYYGDLPEGEVTESGIKGSGFLADLCELWEQEARKAEELGLRVVTLRTGIVLGSGGGALGKMLPPFKFFLGGPLGSGRQWFSWIHQEDETGAILFCLENDSIKGPVNLTASNPVTMAHFCRELGRTLHRPCWAPVPSFVLRLLLGEMSEMLLTGQRVIPQKLTRAGYRFRYPLLKEALQSIVK
jgi:hypothetical protein